jgi:hypothetical protein
MSGANTPIARVKGNSKLVTPKFGPGMLLQHEDLEALHVYTRDLSRLLMRSLFGCGVVCGLRIQVLDDCGMTLVVHPGIALNCAGDPIHVPSAQKMKIDEAQQLEGPDPAWIVLCARTKCCGPRQAACGCDDDEPQTTCTRERIGFEITVTRTRPEDACGCEPYATEHMSTCQCVDPNHPCYADHYKGICGCQCEDCSGGCGCVILGQLTRSGDWWEIDYDYRRFVRPVLVRDRANELPNEVLFQVDLQGANRLAPRGFGGQQGDVLEQQVHTPLAGGETTPGAVRTQRQRAPRPPRQTRE